MGSLRAIASNKVWVLETEQFVGRAQTCSLCIEDRFVSAQHATVRWDGARWVLRDLGSRNGTFLNGERLPASQNHRLQRGDQLAFGTREAGWVVEDVSEPLAMVVGPGGRYVLAEEALIVLPSADKPTATIFADSNGEWVLEIVGISRVPILPGQSFELDGGMWRFSAATTLNLTSLADLRAQCSVADYQLCFAVTRDEETVSVELRQGVEVIKLPGRSFQYMLLTLARARARDQADGLDDVSSGWMYQDELLKGLGITLNSLNVDIYRARKQIAALGLLGGADIVERRPRAGQLRIGCAKLSIQLF